MEGEQQDSKASYNHSHHNNGNSENIYLIRGQCWVLHAFKSSQFKGNLRSTSSSSD